MQPNFKHLEVSQVQIQDGHQGSYYSPWQDTGSKKLPADVSLQAPAEAHAMTSSDLSK